jgi:hypothetical protein
MDVVEPAPVPCADSNVQLSLTLIGGQPAKVGAVTVEVSDYSGNRVGTFVVERPQRYDDAAGVYVEWDGSLSPGAPASVSYRLAPGDLPAGTNEGAYNYDVVVTVEAVLQNGIVLRSAPARIEHVAPEPHVVT